MIAMFLMLLIATYLGSTIMLYGEDDNENPFFIVHFLGVALGASLASPKVPLWLICLGAGLAIVAIILSSGEFFAAFAFDILLFIVMMFLM